MVFFDLFPKMSRLISHYMILVRYRWISAKRSNDGVQLPCNSLVNLCNLHSFKIQTLYMGRNISLNCLIINYMAFTLTPFKDTLHVVSSKAPYEVLFLSILMFSHEFKVQIQALLIIYRHWKICFGRFPSVWPCRLWSTHLCICVCMLDQLLSKLPSEEQAVTTIHSRRGLI